MDFFYPTSVLGPSVLSRGLTSAGLSRLESEKALGHGYSKLPRFPLGDALRGVLHVMYSPNMYCPNTRSTGRAQEAQWHHHRVSVWLTSSAVEAPAGPFRMSVTKTAEEGVGDKIYQLLPAKQREPEPWFAAWGSRAPILRVRSTTIKMASAALRPPPTNG